MKVKGAWALLPALFKWRQSRVNGSGQECPSSHPSTAFGPCLLPLKRQLFRLQLQQKCLGIHAARKPR